MSVTVSTFLKMKAEGKKISMITAYDYTTARLVDESGIDSILVGDSLGNVMLGLGDTVSVTMEDMIHHGAAVAAARRTRSSSSICPSCRISPASTTRW